MTWEGTPLGMVEPEQTVRPTIGDGQVVYPGAQHLFTGEPESMKTIGAYAVAIETLRADPQAWVALVDWEMGAALARTRMSEMGATIDELDRILHFEPDRAPRPGELAAALLEPTPAALVVYDASAGAYGVAGLDDNKRQDVERFAQAFIRPLRQARVTTVVLDHVAKAKDGRGRWPIGSERKHGGADVVLGFEAVKQLTRGGDGHVRITTHKDRFGHLPRPRAADLELHSDPDTHAITWTWRPPGDDTAAEWRPTIYMERVSRHLEEHGPLSRTAIYGAGLGKREYLVKAVDCLLADGNLQEDGSRLVPATPYRAVPAVPAVPKPFPAVPDTPGDLRSPVPPSLRRGTGTGTTNGNPTDHEIERLAAILGDEATP